MSACGKEAPPAATPTPSPAPTATVVAVPTPALAPAPTVATQGIDVSKLKSASNRIAFVGADDQIYTADKDGKDRIQVTKDGTYSWPTWSPDGKSLAFSGLVRANNLRQIGLFLGSPFGGDISKIFTNDSRTPALIAYSLTHYIFWAPDSQKLMFIAQTPGTGLTMFLVNPFDVWNPTMLLGGGPLYSTWSPDSKYVMVHRGSDSFLVDASAYPQATDLGFASQAYRVPAWSPKGDRVLLAKESADGTDVMWIADGQGKTIRALGKLDGQAAFLWSPDGEVIAVGKANSDGFYGGLTIISKDGSSQKALTNKEMVAFFWSPDGKKIMYATPPDNNDVMNWVLLDLLKGTEALVTRFIPSDEVSTMLGFFDQFAPSHSLWSPDSSYFAFSGFLPGTSDTEVPPGRLPQPRVYMVDVADGAPPRAVADGSLVVWSWK